MVWSLSSPPREGANRRAEENAQLDEAVDRLVKLGVSANHVIALRMAKLARGGAAARAETKLMVDEKVRAAVDANIEAARSIMTGHVPSRAHPRAKHLPKTRAQEFELSVEEKMSGARFNASATPAVAISAPRHDKSSSSPSRARLR